MAPNVGAFLLTGMWLLGCAWTAFRVWVGVIIIAIVMYWLGLLSDQIPLKASPV